MDITPSIAKGTNFISKYGINGLKINDQYYLGNLILTSDEVIKSSNDNDLFTKIKNLLTDYIPEVLIYSRDSVQDDSDEIYVFLNQLHFAFEEMSLSAACRTFNVLITDGRKVIMIVKQKNSNQTLL